MRSLLTRTAFFEFEKIYKAEMRSRENILAVLNQKLQEATSGNNRQKNQVPAPCRVRVYFYTKYWTV